jgi:hypothetical protein
MNRRTTLLLGAVVALAIFAVMGLTVSKTQPWAQAGNATAQQQANDTDGLVQALFGRLVVPFEILGVLLTAAMIGALVIARPMEAVQDADRYSHPTAEQVAETDRASDPKHAVMSTEAAE